MWWLAHLALVLAALYAAAVAAMYLAQTWLLFPTALAGAARIQLPASASRLKAGTPDSEVLAGVRIPAATGARNGRAPTLLLGFGGNAWNADAMALYLHGLFPGREVAAFHYRGYTRRAPVGRARRRCWRTRCWPSTASGRGARAGAASSRSGSA